MLPARLARPEHAALDDLRLRSDLDVALLHLVDLINLLAHRRAVGPSRAVQRAPLLRLLRLSRALRVAPLPASRGPAPAVHACPRQRLGLGRSALVGDALAPATTTTTRPCRSSVCRRRCVVSL